MLNAQFLVVCTLCQAWAYEPASASIIVIFCETSMWAHGLADGSWSLAWALIQASGCMELIFVIKVFLSYNWLFPTPKRVSVPRPPRLAIRANCESFFFYNILENTLYHMPCLSYVVCYIFIQSSILWSLVVCSRTGHVHFVPSLSFSPTLLRL
jgi:hypothetical protein